MNPWVSDFIYSSLITGSPESTAGKATFDGSLEEYGDIARHSRKQINYHNVNGTDIQAIIHSLKSGTIGSKVNIQSRSEKDKINEAVEDLLKEHGEVENFATDGMSYRDQALADIVAFAHMDGGVIIRHHYDTAWKIPYRLELVGIDMIDTTKTFSYDNVYNGLKKDKYGRITGIYLYDDTTKCISTLHGMENMTYYMNRWVSLSQYTAISRLVNILPTLDGVVDYILSEIKSAKNRAKTGVYWHTELYSILQQALEEEFKSANVTPREKVDQARLLMDEMGRRGVGIEGATPTPREDQITQLDNKSDSVLEAITNNSQKAMASSQGGSQVSVYKDIEKGNYSSIKAAMSFDEEWYKQEFRSLEEKIITPYLRRLYEIGVQIGRIPVARSKYFANPRKYHKWDILRTSKRVIDETKDASALKTKLESDQIQLNQVYAEKGLDYIEEKTKQIALDIRLKQIEMDMYEKANIPLETQTEENNNE